MNIFALDINPQKAAIYHNDRHCVKMILESAQLLCTACHLHGHTKVPYKPTHTKHPSTIWATKSLSNWLWLFELMTELNSEYVFRYDKIKNHMSYDKMRYISFPNIPDIGLTPFQLAMDNKYKIFNEPTENFETSIKNYRYYYIHGKSHLAKWTKRDVPDWYNKIDWIENAKL